MKPFGNLQDMTMATEQCRVLSNALIYIRSLIQGQTTVQGGNQHGVMTCGEITYKTIILR